MPIGGKAATPAVAKPAPAAIALPMPLLDDDARQGLSRLSGALRVVEDAAHALPTRVRQCNWHPGHNSPANHFS